MIGKYIKIKEKIYISRGAVLMLLLSLNSRRRSIYVSSILFAFFHECSHLCAALLMGITPLKIKILINGFELFLQGVSNKKKLVIYLAGPSASLLMYILFYEINPVVSKMNFLIFSVNILPALPLDGGRIFYCITQNINILKKMSRVCEIILYTLPFFEKEYIWLLPVTFLIHNSLNKMPYDIFVNDLIKRLEKESKI